MAFAQAASQLEALVRDVERARDECGSTGLAVLLNDGALPAEKNALSSLPGIAVLCGGASPEQPRQAGPARTPRVLLVRGDAHRIAITQLLRLYSSGARYLLERAGLGWRRRSLAGYIAYRVARAVAVRTVLSLDRLDSRIQGLANGPVGYAASRGIARVRRLIVEARHRGHRRDLAPADVNAPPLLEASAFQPGRVLMINSALTWGGAERQLVNTMIGLQRRGWEVLLACEHLGRVPGSTFFAPELERYGLRHRSLEEIGHVQAERLRQSGTGSSLEGRLGRLPPPFDRALWPYVLAMLEVRPSVVHAWQDHTNVMAGVAAAVVGVPRIVLSARNMAPHRFAYHEPYMRAAYRLLSGHGRVSLVNNSRAGSADYARWLGIPEDAFKVVHNGFDFDLMQAADDADHLPKLPIPEAAPIVGSIFRFYAEKDPGLWMATAAQVAKQRPDCHFLLIGTGPLRAQALDLARRYGIADRVHLPGTLRSPQALLRRMSVFVLTSRLEGLPNVLIEAQALGVPVVATPAGGSAETFLDGKTGWLVDERTPRAIAARIISVLQDRHWVEGCRVQAPQLVRERFGIDRMLDETMAVYGTAPAADSATKPEF